MKQKGKERDQNKLLKQQRRRDFVKLQFYICQTDEFLTLFKCTKWTTHSWFSIMASLEVGSLWHLCLSLHICPFSSHTVSVYVMNNNCSVVWLLCNLKCMSLVVSLKTSRNHGNGLSSLSRALTHFCTIFFVSFTKDWSHLAARSTSGLFFFFFRAKSWTFDTVLET